MRTVNEKFVDLGTPRRIWAVAAIHGDLDRLMVLHDHLATRFATRDRLVYLGNYLGTGSHYNAEVFEELLSFRAALLTKPGMEPQDIAHLRGTAEEAWQRLLRLQFAPVPTQALEKHFESGVESYLRLYNVSLNDTKSIARANSVTITRWTNQLRNAQRMSLGHEAFICSMRRAAITSAAEQAPLLFVPAGFDTAHSLEDQGERLWWNGANFNTIQKNMSPYARIVRGFDEDRGGVQTDGLGVTLDGNCGSGGPLVCGCFNAAGRLVEMIAVGGKGVVESLPLHDRVKQTNYETTAFFKNSINSSPISLSA